MIRTHAYWFVFGLLGLLLCNAPLLAVDATWDGGTGFWNDPLSWSPATVPSNAGVNTYDVFIDGTKTGTSSVVNLNINAVINRFFIDPSDTLNILDGHTLTLNHSIQNNSGTITLENIGASITALSFIGDTDISGSGEILLGNNANNRLTTNNHTITQQAGHTIRGAGNILANSGGMFNDGTILANEALALVIDPNGLGFTNHGTMQATGAGGLTFNAGVFTNAGHSVDVLTGSKLTITNLVRIDFGTLTTAGTGVVNIQSFDSSAAIFKSITTNATVNFADSANVLIEEGLTNNGTWTLPNLGVSVTSVNFNGNINLGGTGEFILTNDSNNWVTSDNNVLTQLADHTIRGAGNLLHNTGGMINQGTIIADQVLPLIIDPNANKFVNQGTLRAEGSGGLTFNAGIFDNASHSIDIANDSKLTITNLVRINDGTLTASGTGFVDIQSKDSSAATFKNITTDTPVSMPDSSDVRIEGGLTNNNTWTLTNAGVSVTSVHFIDGITLGGTGEFVLSNDANNRITTDNTVLTQLAGHTIRGAGSLLANTGGMINQGSIIADQVLPLIIDPNGLGFTNEGTLRAEGSGGLKFLIGVFENLNHSIDIANDSKLTITNVVRINDGTLTATGTGFVNIQSFDSSAATFNNVTTNTPVSMPDSSDVRIEGGLTNNNTWTLTNAGVSVTSVHFIDGISLGGTGEFHMLTDANNRITTNNTVLTQLSDHTIRGAGNLLTNTGGMINQGSIIADRDIALTIDPNGLGFTNQGTLRAEGSGGLNFISGTFINTSQVIDVLDGSRLTINSVVRLEDGSVDATGTGFVHINSFDSSAATFKNVTLNSPTVFPDSADLNIEGGLTNNNTLSLNNAGVSVASVHFKDNISLGGTGEFVLSNDTNNRITTNNTVLTQLADHTIHGAGNLLANTGGMINQGTIIADQILPLSIDPNGLKFINEGTVKATGAGGLIFLAGPFTNTSFTINVENASKLSISSSVAVEGGTLETAGTGFVNIQSFDSAASTFKNVTTVGKVVLPDSADLNIEGGLTNNGTWQLNNIGVSATSVHFKDGISLGGTGEFVLSNDANNRITTNNTVLTQLSGHTIRGSGNLLANTGGMINQGTIIADQATALRIDPNALGFVNEGTLQIDLGKSLIFAAGNFINTATGIITGSGTLNTTAATSFINHGTISPGNSPGRLTVQGNLPSSDTSIYHLELGGTTPITEYDQLNVTGVLTFNGSLFVELIDDFEPALGDTFNLLDWGSITGTFDALNLPALEDSLVWYLGDLYPSGALSVIEGDFLLGDINNDGLVNGFDVDPFVDILLNGPYNPRADINQDALINGFDVDPFVVAVLSGGTTPAIANDIPEPTTLALLGLACLARFRKKRLH